MISTKDSTETTHPRSVRITGDAAVLERIEQILNDSPDIFRKFAGRTQLVDIRDPVRGECPITGLEPYAARAAETLRTKVVRLLSRMERKRAKYNLPTPDSGDLREQAQGVSSPDVGLSRPRCDLIVAGKVKGGKSSFLNTYARKRVLPVGIPATTRLLCRLRHGPEQWIRAQMKDRSQVDLTQAEFDQLADQQKVNAASRSTGGDVSLNHTLFVDIETPSGQWPSGIDVWDTPGLSSGLHSDQHDPLVRRALRNQEKPCAMICAVEIDNVLHQDLWSFLTWVHNECEDVPVLYIMTHRDIDTSIREKYRKDDEAALSELPSAFRQGVLASVPWSAPSVWPVDSTTMTGGLQRNDPAVQKASGFPALEQAIRYLVILSADLVPINRVLRNVRLYHRAQNKRLRKLITNAKAIETKTSTDYQTTRKQWSDDFGSYADASGAKRVALDGQRTSAWTTARKGIVAAFCSTTKSGRTVEAAIRSHMNSEIDGWSESEFEQHSGDLTAIVATAVSSHLVELAESACETCMEHADEFFVGLDEASQPSVESDEADDNTSDEQDDDEQDAEFTRPSFVDDALSKLAETDTESSVSTDHRVIGAVGGALGGGALAAAGNALLVGAAALSLPVLATAGVLAALGGLLGWGVGKKFDLDEAKADLKREHLDPLLDHFKKEYLGKGNKAEDSALAMTFFNTCKKGVTDFIDGVVKKKQKEFNDFLTVQDSLCGTDSDTQTDLRNRIRKLERRQKKWQKIESSILEHEETLRHLACLCDAQMRYRSPE